MEELLDVDDAIERAINEGNSEDDIAAEYVENEVAEYDMEAEGFSEECEHKTKTPSERVAADFSKQPCCSRNCCSTWKEEHLRQHAKELKTLSKTEKKLVVLTILRNGAITSESTRYSAQRQRLRFTFRYEPFGVMCASAFRVLFDVRIDALKGLIAYLKITNMSIVPPVHGNKGKRHHRAHTLLNRGVTDKVVEFMLTLAKAQGEYSPGRHTTKGQSAEDNDPDILWLPGSFTRSTILRMYNTRYPDFHIGRTAFCSVLENDSRLEHINIRSPRSDMCDYCELQKRRIASTKPYDESRAEQLTAELTAHQKAYQGERAVYNAERQQAKMDREKWQQGGLKTDDCLEHIGMDFGQSIGVPHTTDQLGGTYFLHMRNFHLFGMCSVLEHTQVCYTYDEREAGKGANDVISCLHEFLTRRHVQTPNIRIHADNCRGQNTNTYVMWYLLWLAATARVKHVELKFMIKGHTHFIVDSGIGHTKRELRRSNVFCLKHWAHVIERSATTNTARVIDGNDVYDWKAGLHPYFKAFNGISTFQHFAVDATEPGWIWAKYGCDDDGWKKRKLLK